MAATISRLGDLIASVPALLGFVPRDSFVLISTLARPDAPPMVGATQRLDLTQLAADPAHCATRLAANLAGLPVAQLVGVVVRADRTVPITAALPLRSTIDTVATTLRQQCLPPVYTVFVSAFAAGARWQAYTDGLRNGTLPDPATTVVAAATTAAGYTIANSREVLAARYTPAAMDDRTHLRPLINAAVAIVRREGTRSAATHARLARADEAVRAASAGELPTDDAIMADLVATFATSDLRDALLATPSAEISLGAENLALHLWRLAPEPHASHLVTLIAAHAYYRGDGVAARFALEAAGRPVGLTYLLGQCLNNAVPPAKIGQLMNDSAQQIRDQVRAATTEITPSEPSTDQ